MAFELATKGMHILFRPYDAAYRLYRRMTAPLFNLQACTHYRPIHDLESKQLIFDCLAGYDIAGEEGIGYHDPIPEAKRVWLFDFRGIYKR